VEWAVFTLVRWLAPLVRGIYSAVGLVLIVGLALAAAALIGFANLAESVLEGETLTIDERILLWVDSIATPTLDVVALEITSLGSPAVVATLVLVAGAFLWLTRQRPQALLLWVGAAGGVVLNQALKLAFGRPRPRVIEWRVDHVGSYSFPSGHAMASMIIYAMLAYVILDLNPPRPVKRLTVALAATIITLVGLSRIYLGVHYPTDILAGYAVGFAWATLCAFNLRVIDYVRRKQRET
jgi:membrane-associated phospholipid phosphatase